MSLVLMGASFKSATIDLRERLAIPQDQVPGAISELLACNGVQEALVLSTCNRVEAYVDAKTDRLGSDALRSFFLSRSHDESALDGLYLRRGMDVVTHVHRVVCSLDSQLLGEAQILGQTRGAFELAQCCEGAGEVLTHLFKGALHLGKKVRSETSIGADSVSLSTTAFKLASDFVPDIRSARVLIVGTGEMAALCARYLVDAGVRDLHVTGHNLQHTQQFAREYSMSFSAFDERHNQAALADVVFSMTSAPDAVICADELASAREQNATKGRPLLMIDEAVPRDIDPACADLPGVTLHNLESLVSVVDEGMARRMAAVGDVERMAGQADEEFFTWLQQRNVAPTIKGIHTKSGLAVKGESEKAARALARLLGRDLTDQEIELLQVFGQAVANKILHGPMARLRKEAGTADSYYYTAAARYLFGLDTNPEGSGMHRPCVGARLCQVGGCAAGAALDRRRELGLADPVIPTSDGAAAAEPCRIALAAQGNSASKGVRR